MSKVKFQNADSIQHIKHLVHKKWKHLYYNSTYNSFFTGEIQEDACECLMLLIEIMDKGFGLCPINDNTNTKGSFSELLFSFVLEKHITCDICTMKSPDFETTR